MTADAALAHLWQSTRFCPRSDASLEPGVFGIVRPVLVWPRDIDTKLDEAQVDAITSFNRIVQNQTGLEGNYDFDFRWTNEFGPGRGALPGGPPPAPAPGDEPTPVTALQEQLGLKLDARRATVDVLVIDSIERPTEN